MCLLDIICFVAKMRYKQGGGGGVIRKGLIFDHFVLQYLSFVRRIRRTNTQKIFLFPEGRYVKTSISSKSNGVT